jgi:hypothetical protein
MRGADADEIFLRIDSTRRRRKPLSDVPANGVEGLRQQCADADRNHRGKSACRAHLRFLASDERVSERSSIAPRRDGRRPILGGRG